MSSLPAELSGHQLRSERRIVDEDTLRLAIIGLQFLFPVAADEIFVDEGFVMKNEGDAGGLLEGTDDRNCAREYCKSRGVYKNKLIGNGQCELAFVGWRQCFDGMVRDNPLPNDSPASANV